MATVKVYLDRRSQKKDLTFPIKLLVQHKGTFTIALGISVLEHQFVNGEVYGLEKKRKESEYNSKIRQALGRAETAINETQSIQLLSNSELKAKMTGIDEDQTKPLPLLKDYYDICIKKANKENTAEAFKYSLDYVRKFDRDDIPFKEITVSWLEDFEIFMKQHISQNTISIVFRNLRAVYNRAITDHPDLYVSYPFRKSKFRIKSEKTRKRSLKTKQLVLLRDYPCERYQKKYKDLFMLVFYLIGINMVDLANLKKEDIVDGRIEYTRAKTGKKYSIKIEPETQTILDRHQGKEYLLDILDQYSNYKDFVHRMNIGLKKFGYVTWIENRAKNPEKVKKNKKVFHPFFSGISIYWARHSWATVASKIGIDKDTISAALGHENGSKVTNLYIDFDQNKIDKANRKVIKYISERRLINPDNKNGVDKFVFQKPEKKANHKD